MESPGWHHRPSSTVISRFPISIDVTLGARSRECSSPDSAARTADTTSKWK